MEGILISELKEKKIIDGSEIIPVESKNQNYNINVNNLKNFINDIENGRIDNIIYLSYY